MLSVQASKRLNLQAGNAVGKSKAGAASVYHLGLLGLLGLAFATACSPASSGENDPNAIYGSQAGKNTFIVSHVFNAGVYEKQLGFALPQAPEFSTPDVLLQCFYELQLTDQELNQCGQSTGVGGYSNLSQTALNEHDIWRLMILQSEKTAALSEFVVPQSVFNYEVQNNWKSDSDLNSIATQTAQVTGIPASGAPSDGRARVLSLTTSPGGSSPSSSQLGLVDLKQVLNPVNWFRGNAGVIGGQYLNSANCLTTQNPLALAQAVINALGWLSPAKPIVAGIGALINFIRPAQVTAPTFNHVAQNCGGELVRAAQNNAPAATPPQAKQLVAIENAVTNSDPEALKRLLREETNRQIESINSSNFQMKSTLKESANKVPGQSIAELRSRIRNLSTKVGTSLNGARCLPAKRFVGEVLRPVLIASNNGRDSAATLDARSGCNVTSAAAQPTVTVNTPVATEAKQLAAVLEPLVAQGQAVRNEILNNNATNAGGNPPVAASSAAGTALEQYKKDAPSTCSTDNATFASLPVAELAERLKTCSAPLAASDATHTFGKFSDALRQSCVAASSQSSLALATCLCSCRWSTPFYNYLAK